MKTEDQSKRFGQSEYERGLREAAAITSRWLENNRLHPDIPNESLIEAARVAAHSVLQQAALDILTLLNKPKEL